MDRSEMRALLDDSLRPMRAALNLNDWFMRSKLASMEDGFVAECVADPNYSTAKLTFDVNGFENPSVLLDSLLHEMLHVMTAKFELYRKAIRPLIDDHKVWMSLEEVYTHACEDTVRRLEDMLRHGLNTTPRRLITRGKKLLELE